MWVSFFSAETNKTDVAACLSKKLSLVQSRLDVFGKYYSGIIFNYWISVPNLLNTAGMLEYLNGLILLSLFFSFDISTSFSVVFEAVDELLIQGQISAL